MNTDNTGREYATKDIANIVNIAPPTVRKYSQALEKAGYTFDKNENGNRIFTDKDIFVFNEIKSLSKKTAMPVEKIAEMIVFNQKQEIQHEAVSDIPKIIQSESGNSSEIVQYDSRYNELMSKLEKLDMLDDILSELQEQRQFNSLLLGKLKEQQDYISERDKKLMSSLKSSMEVKQLQTQLDEIKATLSEVAAGKEQKKPKWKFW